MHMKNSRLAKIILGVIIGFYCILPGKIYAEEPGSSDTINVGTVGEISNSSTTSKAGSKATPTPGTTSGGNSNASGNNSAISQTVSNTYEGYNESRLDIEDELDGYIEFDTDADTFFERLIAKEYKLMNSFQRIVLPFFLGGVIVGFLLLLWGAISKRMSIMPGLWTIIASGIGYTGVRYAPEILNFFSRFLTE